MNVSLQYCLRRFKQSWTTVILFSRLKNCTKVSAVTLSDIASKKTSNDYESSNMERAKLIFLKNLATINKLDIVKKQTLKSQHPNCQSQRTVNSPYNGTGCSDYYEQNLQAWANVLMNQKYEQEQDKQSRSVLKDPLLDLMVIKHEMWYYNSVTCNDNYARRCNVDMKDYCFQFTAKNTVSMETQSKRLLDKKPSTPSPEQLSLVLLRLREELPYFFEGHHRYSIYSEDLLFVNKLTRTTTRSLKAYKFVMKFMQYLGKLLWSEVTLDIVRITKHPEDNTIKLRWTAKGIPWYQLPFLAMTGKTRSSLFYRYVDGFSIFEVGRDGLVHCHRLDKVIPTSSPERQKWSLRIQILTALGLAEIDQGACEAFQVKTQDILKKVG